MKDFLQKEKHPYLCAPITGKTREAIATQLTEVMEQQPDLIEWRADFYEALAQTESVVAVLYDMKQATDIPILFTIRAVHEGGEDIQLSEEEKVDLLGTVCRETAVDCVDFEISNAETDVRMLVETAHANGKEIILSYHNFQETPSTAFLLEQGRHAEKLGADVAKLAVMPSEKADVFQLLDVTRELDRLLAIPVVTMSMGEIGALSRITGWMYGSHLTFGVGVESSAPGQVPVKKLREAIELTQSLAPNWRPQE